MSRITLGLLLLGMWLLLWGELSVGNVASGVLVIALLYLVFPSTRPLAPRTLLHPGAFARLVGYFLVQLVASNLLVAREVVSRRSRLRAHIVSVPMRTSSPGILTLVTNITALTPGVVATAVETSPPTITVHALVLRDVDEVNEDLWRVEELCVRAFGTAEAVAELGDPPRRERSEP